MKQITLKLHCICLLSLTAILCAPSITAQVTVGSGIPPEKAAILDIKSQEADGDNITSKQGGLGLPRVKLVNIKTLEPFILTTDTEWNPANQADTKKVHTGLIVYNLETANGFFKDTYVWDGDSWKPIGGIQQRYFYIPSFNIPLTAVGATVVTDLYGEYEAQFNGLKGFVSSNPALTTVPVKPDGSIYQRDELDYIITYYDASIIENVTINDGSITAANRGKLSFKTKKLDTSPNSFLNVVFVIK